VGREQELADLATALDDLHELRVPVGACDHVTVRGTAEAITCMADVAACMACVALMCFASTAAMTSSGDDPDLDITDPDKTDLDRVLFFAATGSPTVVASTR
jgi:hypothetical protein